MKEICYPNIQEIQNKHIKEYFEQRKNVEKCGQKYTSELIENKKNAFDEILNNDLDNMSVESSE